MTTQFRADFLRHYKTRRAEGHRPQQARAVALSDARYGTGDGRQTRIAMRKRSLLPSPYDAYDGDEVTELPNGWKIKVEFQRDDDHEAPWKECCSMGVIKECHSHPGDSYDDWILNSDRGWYRYFDWKATLPEAIRDRWDSPPYHSTDKHERAMRAMRSTYDYLRRWCNDDWWYVGLIVTLLDEDDNEIAEDSCWGYESCCIAYLCEEARSWAASMIREARKDEREQRRQEWIANRWHDAQNLGVTA